MEFFPLKNDNKSKKPPSRGRENPELLHFGDRTIL